MNRFNTTLTGCKHLCATAAGLSVFLGHLPAMAAAEAAEDRITVVARAEDATDAGEGLFASRSRTATKSDTPLLEMPQSISVITRRQLDDQNVRSLNEVLRYSPGVGTEQWGTFQRWDQRWHPERSLSHRRIWDNGRHGALSA